VCVCVCGPQSGSDGHRAMDLDVMVECGSYVIVVSVTISPAPLCPDRTGQTAPHRPQDGAVSGLRMSLRLRHHPSRTVWLRCSGRHRRAAASSSAADVDRPPASGVMTSSLAIFGLAPVGSWSHGHRASATHRGQWAGRRSGDRHYGGRVEVDARQPVDAWAQRSPTLDGADGDGWSSGTSSGCGSLTPHPSPACASPPAPTTSSRLFSLRPPASPSCHHAGVALAMQSYSGRM